MLSKKRIIILLGILVVFILVAYLISASKTPAITYLTEPVKRGSIENTVIANGTVRSSNRVEVGAQVSGQIKKIYVTLGQSLKKGDLIAEIDSTTQQNNLNTAQAQLDSYKAQLQAKETAYEVALSSYNRLKSLYAKKATTLDDLNTAKNTLATAQASIAEVQANIKQAEIEVNTATTNLGYTKITSPIDGVVISIPVSEGQTVNANQSTPTIVQVADLDKMLIKAEISEGDITKVTAGLPVHFNILSDPDRIYHSTIYSVDPALSTLTDDSYTESVSDTDAVYYYANILVSNEDMKLRIGMTAQTTIIIAQAENALYVPTLTLKKSGNKTYVNVLTADNQVEKREVTTGIHDDMNTEITSGLNEGERVISSQISEGETVSNNMRGPRIL
ncbi:efflux RND transporter periplasmic adaptor subunit [Basilea psittacipulmonis]|uniref:ABC transporter substrate-binding protein n=1 Tax=Basilea psittacipulmonis DSM 24701 TaxID=1072685 RepID=A0A077DD19_9BURK|nr:efflux RND transporter periplasmic adaptor subunit [Basilea psittacipulmonis]AIL32509.1 ABC transporter substrate-binding protein [Basilea psittacipulmonis DSM 24701]